MTNIHEDTIHDLLLRNIPRDLVMGIEEALIAGAQRAYDKATGMDEGHLPHVVGQMRHFHMNESFYRALVTADASPSPIRGNSIVTGRAGIFRLARFNIPQGFWINGRRSQTRRHMAAANKAIEPLVQPELFDSYVSPTEAVAFFVACFSGSLQNQPKAPVSIQIAVPSRDMKSWLFREPLDLFMNRYEIQPNIQEDLAMPKLKGNISKQIKGSKTP